MSIVRVVKLGTLDFTDITYANATALVWSAIEVNLAVICSCLPVLAPLLPPWMREKLTGSSGYSGGSGYLSSSRLQPSRSIKADTITSTVKGDGDYVFLSDGPFPRTQRGPSPKTRYPISSDDEGAPATVGIHHHPRNRQVPYEADGIRRTTDISVV